MRKRTGNKWVELNEHVMNVHSVDALKTMLDEMISTQAGLRYILRVHSRLNALRYRHERRDICANFIKKKANTDD